MKKNKIILISAGWLVMSLLACSDAKPPAENKDQQLQCDVLEAPEKDIAIESQRRKTQGPPGDAVILLDFNGHYVANTMWNVYGPFQANNSGLSAAAQQRIFDTVALHFSGFNVQVTVDEKKYNRADDFKRMRVIITTSHDWYGTGAGGTAYLNSFSWGDNTPCFVFSALYSFSVKKIADAVSHEAGHTFGLRHQVLYNETCGIVNPYNPGTLDSGVIMGYSPGSLRAYWISGPNSIPDTVTCGKMQNDAEIINSKL